MAVLDLHALLRPEVIASATGMGKSASIGVGLRVVKNRSTLQGGLVNTEDWVSARNAKHDKDNRPCQCHKSFATVTALHGGHCCFFPISQTCHAEEVAEWERKKRGGTANEIETAGKS